MSRQLEDAIVAVRGGHANSLMVRCTAHDDGQASLHVSAGTDSQPVVLKCHAGCENADILREANLDWAEVCKPLDQAEQRNRPTIQPIAYQYEDENGQVLFETVRMYTKEGRKTFRQRHIHNGAMVYNLKGVRRVLYRLPDVVAAVRDGKTIWLVEGEKDVQSLNNLGEVATTNPMGAGKWLPEYTEILRGATVHVIADADTPGRNHAREVAKQLEEADCQVRTFEARQGKDVTNHLEAGLVLEELVETTQDADVEMPAGGLDILEYVGMTFSEQQFVIPGTLAREERLLVTGFEGHGKSTLLRQISVCVAAGIHPWTLRPMPPQRVMVIDAENGTRQMQKSWSGLVGHAAHWGAPIQPGMLTLLPVYLEQPDLTSIEGREWLMERVAGYRPDLIVMGPVQNLTSRDVKDDDVVRRFKRTVDDSRQLHGSAVIMEHHVPHKAPGEKARSLRPYGSSLFLKWPDFGYGMKPVVEEDGVYDWERQRWPRERTRLWPDRLRWGVENTAEWPWMEAEPDTRGSTNVRSA